MEQAQTCAARLWTAGYGPVKLDRLCGHCIIDNPDYGAGTVSWAVGARGESRGGTRTAGLRPLYPDAHLREVHKDFYASLKESIEKDGVKVPVLLWEINGKLYCRYGASRVHVAGLLERDWVPAIVSSYSHDPAPYFAGIYKPLPGVRDVLDALGPVKNVGHFIVDHEKLDIHNVVPW